MTSLVIEWMSAREAGWEKVDAEYEKLSDGVKRPIKTSFTISAAHLCRCLKKIRPGHSVSNF